MTQADTATLTTTALFGSRVVVVAPEPVRAVPPQTKPLPHQMPRCRCAVIPYCMDTFAATPAEAKRIRQAAALCSPSRFALTGGRDDLD